MKKRIAGKFRTAQKLISAGLVEKGIFSVRSRKRLCILMYHGIDQVQDTRFNERFFSARHFEQHIAFLTRHTHVLTDAEFASRHFHKDKLNILITFDDGYANNFRYARPILEKYKAHAYFFVTGVGHCSPPVLWADAVDIVAVMGSAGSQVLLDGHRFELREGRFFCTENNSSLKTFIKASTMPGYAQKQQLVEQLLSIFDFTKQADLADYWQLMTDSEIAAAAQSPCITIGSHGYYHHNLAALTNSDALAEVTRSRQYLEQVTGKEVRSIAFPDGSYTETLNDGLFQAGIDRQFLVSYHADDKRERNFTFDRVGLYPSMGNTHQLIYKMLHG